MRQGAFAFNGNKPAAQPSGVAPQRPQMAAGGMGMGAGTPPPPPSFLAQAMQQRAQQPMPQPQPMASPPGGSGMPPMPAPLPQTSASAPPMVPPSPRGRDLLASRVQARPVAPDVGVPDPPRRERPAQFVPGVPGKPKSGKSVHEMMRDPETLRTLAERVKAWEAENPKRKLRGSHIQQMLGNVSPAQARNVLARIEKARRDMEGQQVASAWDRGALKAMTEG